MDNKRGKVIYVDFGDYDSLGYDYEDKKELIVEFIKSIIADDVLVLSRHMIEFMAELNGYNNYVAEDDEVQMLYDETIDRIAETIYETLAFSVDLT